MDRNKIVLIAIAILVIALLALGAYIITSNGGNGSVNDNVTVNKSSNNSSIVMIDEKGNVTNDTVVGDNPQTDSYVTVIGEAYDDEVDRWYTYDTDGVRYYNTRIIA